MPQTLGRYVCDEDPFVSDGVTIWKCKDDRSRRYVIESVRVTPENEYALNREIRILERITQEYQDPLSLYKGGCHPAITCLRDHFLVGDRMYLVFDHFDGIELTEVVNEMTCEQARIVFQHVGEALLFLHSHGIAHENLSAETVGFSDKTLKIELVSFESACMGGGCSENSFEKDKIDWLKLGQDMSGRSLEGIQGRSIRDILDRDPLRCAAQVKRETPKSKIAAAERINPLSRLSALPSDIVNFFVAPMAGRDNISFLTEDFVPFPKKVKTLGGNFRDPRMPRETFQILKYVELSRPRLIRSDESANISSDKREGDFVSFGLVPQPTKYGFGEAHFFLISSLQEELRAYADISLYDRNLKYLYTVEMAVPWLLGKSQVYVDFKTNPEGLNEMIISEFPVTVSRLNKVYIARNYVERNSTILEFSETGKAKTIIDKAPFKNSIIRALPGQKIASFDFSDGTYREISILSGAIDREMPLVQDGTRDFDEDLLDILADENGNFAVIYTNKAKILSQNLKELRVIRWKNNGPVFGGGAIGMGNVFMPDRFADEEGTTIVRIIPLTYKKKRVIGVAERRGRSARAAARAPGR